MRYVFFPNRSLFWYQDNILADNGDDDDEEEEEEDKQVGGSDIIQILYS